ncbi:MAG: GIY-YIG nuclease family protein [Candidatus Hodarchaeales archaeon]
MESSQIIHISPYSEQFQNIPEKPGVYWFLNKNGDILYIGASSNLRKRVKNYFVDKKNPKLKHRVLKRLTQFIEYSCFFSKTAAFEAEKIQIRKYKPPYNRRGVKDGSFSYLAIRYYPFTQFRCYSDINQKSFIDEGEVFVFNLSHIMLKQLLHAIRKIIPFCMPSSSSVCWDHQLGLCYNSCRCFTLQNVSNNHFQTKTLVQTLSESNRKLINNWQNQISICVETLQFEQANKYLKALDSIKDLQLKYCGNKISKDKLPSLSININHFLIDNEDFSFIRRNKERWRRKASH